MQIYLDTANVKEITEGVSTGIVGGVTTNPTIISRENKLFDQCVTDILAIDPDLTVLVEVIADDARGMIDEARKLAKAGPNMVIKIPMTAQGLAAVKVLSL
jgi:transaldolase